MSSDSNWNYELDLARHSILEAQSHLEDAEKYLAKIGYTYYLEKLQRKISGLLTIYKKLGLEFREEK